MMIFSIITVCRNAENEIERTLKSVLEQSMKDYEILIIDGLSSDNTMTIIENYKQEFIKRGIAIQVISEKDAGIYNAMNKGVRLANGQYTIMMNAGDCFNEKIVLENVAKELDADDIVYGNVFVVRSHNSVEEKSLSFPKNIDLIKKEMVFCHQSVFCKTSLLKDNPFDETFKIAADYKFFLSMYLQNQKFRYLNLNIADYYLDGISTKNWYQTCKEHVQVRDEMGLINKDSLSIKLLFLKLKVFLFLRKITPRWLRRLLKREKG